MGEASSKAQKLPQTITTSLKLFNSDNKLYMRVGRESAIGILKVGTRKLFIRDIQGQIKEINPLCVLDFYVHESCQRGGHGLAIFEEMLSKEGLQPEKLAYDRPSEKLISFLRKHYGLSQYVPQNNNFVVFNQYFNPAPNTRNPAQRQEQQHPTAAQNESEAMRMSKKVTFSDFSNPTPTEQFTSKPTAN